MEELIVPSDDLHLVAKEFSKASKESQEIIDRLEKVTKQLEEKWSGATQQVFYKHYKDWQAHMRIYATFLKEIAQELYGLAERFEQIDNQ
jgi:WXG100 family type VII secretion target